MLILQDSTRVDKYFRRLSKILQDSSKTSEVLHDYQIKHHGMVEISSDGSKLNFSEPSQAGPLIAKRAEYEQTFHTNLLKFHYSKAQKPILKQNWNETLIS